MKMFRHVTFVEDLCLHRNQTFESPKRREMGQRVLSRKDQCARWRKKWTAALRCMACLSNYLKSYTDHSPTRSYPYHRWSPTSYSEYTKSCFSMAQFISFIHTRTHTYTRTCLCFKADKLRVVNHFLVHQVPETVMHFRKVLLIMRPQSFIQWRFNILV